MSAAVIMGRPGVAPARSVGKSAGAKAAPRIRIGLIPLALYLAAFFPLLWISGSGFLSRQVMFIFGAFLCFVCLARGLLPMLMLNFPMILMGTIYLLFVNYFWHDTFPYWPKDVLASLIYGVAAGTVLTGAQRRREEEAATMALVLTGILSSLAAYAMVEWTGATLSMGGEGVERSTNAEAWVVFGVLGSGNNIIGVITMTIISLSLVVILLSRAASLTGIAEILGLFIGTLSCLKVATRTSVIAGMVVTAVLTVLLARDANVRRRIFRAIPVTAAVLMFSVVLMIPYFEALLEPFRARFSELTSDSRYDLWVEAAKLLFLHPLGGGYRDLTSHIWAHNIFMDIGLMSGIFGLVPAAYIYFSGFLSARQLQRLRPLTLESLDVPMLAIGLGYFVCALTMPPDPASLATAIMTGVYFSGRVTDEVRGQNVVRARLFAAAIKAREAEADRAALKASTRLTR